MQELIDLFSCRCNHFNKQGRGLRKETGTCFKFKVEEDVWLEKTTTAQRRLSHEMQSSRLAVEPKIAKYPGESCKMKCKRRKSRGKLKANLRISAAKISLLPRCYHRQ